MIIKSYEINKINLKKNNVYLLYGENEGFKNKVINDTFKKFSKNIYKHDEKEILNNKENFFNKILSKSFFETEKLIIILRSTDKIVNIIEEIIEKNIEDTKIILLANILEKKSKLRTFFEKNKDAVRWKKLAKSTDTIVIMMGLSRISIICKQLSEGGMDKKTPVAVIQDGTTSKQKMITGTISNIAQKVKASKIKPPSIIIIGKVVSLSKTIGWRKK